MDKKEFFAKGFVYLVAIFIFVYLMEIWGQNFSISLLVWEIVGLLMVATVTWFLYCLPDWVGKRFFGLLVFVSYVCFIVESFCFYVFDSTLSSAMIATVLETNTAEALDFASIYLEWPFVLMVLLISVCTAAYFYLLRMSIKKWMSVVFSIFVSLGLIGIVYEGYLLLVLGASCKDRKTLSHILPAHYSCMLKIAIVDLKDAKYAFEQYKQNILQNVLPKIKLTPPP